LSVTEKINRIIQIPKIMPSKYDEEGTWIFEDWIAIFRRN
jgi:hypothetical protein